jgi:hypothetical protein
MVGRIIALIALSGIISLVSTIHGNVYANLIIGKNEINSNQIQPFSPIASLINNQSTNKELMYELKSQIQHSDPFKVRGIDNDSNNNSINLSSREDIYSKDVNSKDVNSKDVNSKDVNSKDVKHNDDNDCNSNCHQNSKPTKYDIPFELPSIPFP